VLFRLALAFVYDLCLFRTHRETRRFNRRLVHSEKYRQTRSTEVAQIYASLPDSAGEPPKRLVGWTRLELAPGESKQVSVPVSRDRLTVYDEASDSWKLVPEATSSGWQLIAGSSIATDDFVLRKKLPICKGFRRVAHRLAPSRAVHDDIRIITYRRRRDMLLFGNRELCWSVFLEPLASSH